MLFIILSLLSLLLSLTYNNNSGAGRHDTPNLPTNIVPTNIAWLKLSGESRMGLGIPPLEIKIMLQSNPPKSTMLVGRLAVYFYNHTTTIIDHYYMIITIYHYHTYN